MASIHSSASSHLEDETGASCTAPATFRDFREELSKEGFFARAPLTAFWHLTLFVAGTGVGVITLLLAQSALLVLVAMLLITVASLGVSTVAHTASHGAIANRAWLNKAITYFGFPLFLQVSASFWRHKHLSIHHQHPNVIGVDGDADLSPFFVLTQEELLRAQGWRRLLYKFQVLYLPVLLVGNAFNVIRCGWAYLIVRLLDRNERNRDHWTDLCVLLLHYTVWFALPMLVLPAASVLLFNVGRFAMISYGMYIMFAPAHLPSEAVFLRPGSVRDAISLQTQTTINYRTGWFGSLICGGLQYQIEHHLLPSVSPVHFPRLSSKVREYCEVNGYAYRTLNWPEALWKSVAAFSHPRLVWEGEGRPAEGPSTSST
jgi:linoleoyl-CoA desaturase